MTTWTNVMIPKEMANEIEWTAAWEAMPTRDRRGSTSRTMAGSPTQPRPREAMVIPSWQVER